MRRWVWIAGILTTIASAHAQTATPRYVAKGGMTYTLETTTKTTQNDTVVFSFTAVFERRVLDEDGVTARVASSYRDIVAIDQKLTQAEEVEKQELIAHQPAGGEIRYRYFYPTRTVLNVPGPNGSWIRLTTSVECDWSKLAGFFPIGRTPQVGMECTFSSQKGDEPIISSPMQVVVSFEGDSHVAVPAGEFDVRNVRIVSHDGPARTNTLLLFSEQLGLSVRTDFTTELQRSDGQYGLVSEVNSVVTTVH